MIFEYALRECVSGFCTLTDQQVEVLGRHYELLARWNRKVNLTSVVEPREAAWKHYGESLYLAAQLPIYVRRVADIGSGAGFPGFPVAVLRPECTVTLVESDTRKAAFLHECRDLAPNVAVINARAEGLPVTAPDTPVPTFDLLLSRAVSLKDVDGLIPTLAPVAFALTACEGSTWNVVSHLPWDGKSCVVSRGTGKL